MTTFEYELGEIVCLDPTGAARGATGKIVGRVEWLKGEPAYIVSTAAFGRDGVIRHQVSECEIHRPPSQPN